MIGDLSSPRHLTEEINGFKGLLSNVQDPRNIPPGFLKKAINVIFDKQGNVRPRDGAEEWWPAISQRLYLAEMEPSENASWSGGSSTPDTSTFAFGFQSRKVVFSSAGTDTAIRSLPSPLDLLFGSEYTQPEGVLHLWIRVTAPANISSFVLALRTTASDYMEFNVTSQVNAATASLWAEITVSLNSPTSIVGSPNLSNISSIAVTVTATAAVTVNYDEIFVSYTDFTKSFCLGGIEFRKISDNKRYTLAAFGDTLYADLNEARKPYKVFSQRTRNAPTYFEIAEDRAFIFNGLDPNMVFTGSTYRKVGFPPPTSLTSITDPGGTGNLSIGATYYYGYTFVYGEGAVRHGESSMFEFPTGFVATVSGRAQLNGIEVGGVGSGVIARRIYRCRGNAGPNATKYFVGEISDNTTTTFIDDKADSAIILGAEGPLDNGIPPIAKFAKWYQKGMVYATKTSLHYSRPGNNLNETPETVPATNFILLGNAGEITGLIEFNGNLYVFQKHGIGKVNWRGSVLEYFPVQRTGEGDAQNIGAYDMRAITVVENRYILFMDSEGQIWKMIPNEEIFRASDPVANILDDFNRLPVATSLNYYKVDSEAQWNTGTLALPSNLTTSGTSGQLRYKNVDELSGASFSVTSVISPLVTRDNLSTERSIIWGGATYDVPDTHYIRYYLEALHPVALYRLKFHIRKVHLYQSASLQVNIYKYKYESPNPLTDAGSLLGTVTVPCVDTFDFYFVEVVLPFTVYIPFGERILVEVKAVGPGGVAFHLTSDQYYGVGGDSPFFVSDTRFFTYSIIDSHYRLLGGCAVGFMERRNNQAIVYRGDFLQRYFSAKVTDVDINGSNSIQIYLATSTDGFNYYNQQLIYSLKAINSATIDNKAPAVEENKYIYDLSDYRPGTFYPSNTQFRYAKVNIIFDHDRKFTPSAEAYSAVSLNINSTFCKIDFTLAESTEPSFYSVYNKNDYIRDHWTSEIVNAGSIAKAKLYADYVENQQKIYFQIRSATSAGGIATASFIDITPNTVFDDSSVLVPGATHFQLRIIFQDDPAKRMLEPSYVNDITLAWAEKDAELAPLIPPVLFYYKEYVYGSWPSRDSRILDRSIAMDAFYQTYEDVPHRFSIFTLLHYGVYFTVGGKLIGGPVSGGKLLRLRNSQVADDNFNQVFGPTCYIETHPIYFGTNRLKTLHEVYLGMNLNVFKDGYIQDELLEYPTINYVIPYSFDISVHSTAANRLITEQMYASQESHSFRTTMPKYKPYINEYGFQLGLQDKAFAISVYFRAAKDIYGVSIFPVITGVGLEYFLENIRGV